MARIVATATAYPPLTLTSADSAEYLARLFGDQFTAGRSIRAMVERSGIEQRHIALPVNALAAERPLERKMAEYAALALDLLEQAARTALERAGVEPRDIDQVVSVSCTGFLIPSLDALLAPRLGLRQDVKRLPITALGCVGGAMAIARAHDYLKGHPHDRLLLLGVELPSLTFQPQDRSHDAVLSAMIFGDGAAAFVMTGDAGTGPRIVATQSTLVPDTLDVMGFDLRDRGFHIRLTNDVIPTVNTHLRSVVQGFLAEHEMVPRDLTFAVLHPGGARILDAVQELLGLDEGILGPTRASLAANGNMSSVSVMDIVDRLHASPPDAGSYGLLAGFGPGFSVELGLLQWQ